MSYRGATFTEMDTDALLTRHPRVALMDELARSNVPGCLSARRWQDVEARSVALTLPTAGRPLADPVPARPR